MIRLPLVVALVLAGCSRQPLAPAAPRNQGAQSAAAVAVESLCADYNPFNEAAWPTKITMRGSNGSGVIIDDRHALTALHVVECPFLSGALVTMANGRRLHVVVDRIDRDRDLARLVIASADRFRIGAPVAIGVARIGKVACTATAQPERGRNCGRVETRTAALAGDVVLTQMTLFGNSGSGVYDELGALIGVTVAVSRDRTVGFATSVENWSEP